MSIKLTVNKNNYYSIRFRVDKLLQPYFNKSYIKKSLHTKNKLEARTKADMLYFSYKKLLEVASMLTDEQIQQLVNEYITEQLEQDLNSRAINGVGLVYAPADDVHFQDIASASKDLISSFIGDYKQGLANSDTKEIENIGKELLENVGLSYDSKDSSHRQFMLQLLQGHIQLFDTMYHRYSGNFTPQQKANNLKTTSLAQPTVKVITIKEAFNRFDNWYKKTDITEKHYRNTISRLNKIILPFIGLDRDVTTITLDDIDELKEFLESFPNISRLPYKHMSFKELLEVDGVPSEFIISNDTQSKYLKIVKQLFSFMVDDGIIGYNPCKRLIMPDDEQKKREPFSNEDMKVLFNEFDKLDNKKYIYYSLAYTGMRPSELWKAKISQEDDIYYFDLTSEDIELKTKQSRRKIPLHCKLIELCIQDKLSSLQTEFKQEYLSIYFNKTIKKALADDDNKIMYSFRHTVATELKRADVNMDKVSELLGHSYENNSMTKSTYASGYTLQQLKEAIDCLSF
nr:site-specific integrase [uncultured Sulfurimonas sp.]